MSIAGITKQKRGGRVVWRARVKLNGRRSQATFTKESDAKAALPKLRAELEKRQAAADGEPDWKGEVPTLAKFSDDYMKTDAATNNRDRTVREKKGMLRRGLLPRLGALRLDQIDRRRVEQYKAARIEDGLAPKTVNEELGLLGRILRVAAEDEVIVKVPAIRKLKLPPAKFDHLDGDEQTRLVRGAMLEPDPWGAMVLTALKTGMRMGELRALRWEHVDLVAKRIHVRTAADDRGAIEAPKNNKARVIEIPDVLVAALREHRHLRPFVFSNADGSMLSPRQCENGIHRACRRAGLRLVGWHALRHSYCSTLIAAGAPLAAVRELVGHGSLQMLMRYSHMTPDNRRDVVALLDRGSGATSGATETAKAP